MALAKTATLPASAWGFNAAAVPEAAQNIGGWKDKYLFDGIHTGLTDKKDSVSPVTTDSPTKTPPATI